MNRSFDASFMNSVINHPAVRDGAQAKGVVDVSALIANRKNVMLQNEHGGFIIIEKMPGIYEWHTQFLPSGRGESVRECVRFALRYMFIKTDCMRIITTASTPAAIKLASEFMNERGSNHAFRYYSLDYDQWAETDAELKAEGERFHHMIGDKKNHDDDDTHDYRVGAACLMFKSGNIAKAQSLYNQWALMSGYEPAIVENVNPLIIKNGNLLLSIDEGAISCL